MKGRRNQDQGATRGRSSSRCHRGRQERESVQEPKEERGETVELQPRPRAEGRIRLQRRFNR